MLAFVNGWSCEPKSDAIVCSCDHGARRTLPGYALTVTASKRTSHDDRPPSLRIATSKDLTGSVWIRTIGHEVELVAVLTDGTYDYTARALVPRSDHGAFYDLLDSIEPLQNQVETPSMNIV